MVDVSEVPDSAYTWGEHNGAAASVERIRSACADADRHDPLDEAALLRLKHHGLSGSRLWLLDDSGFAFAHPIPGATSLELAVAPSSRVCGFGGRLAEAALDGIEGPVVAWSHGDHPGAARLAERFGFTANRSLWLMRRSMSQPLLAPYGLPLRGFRSGDEAELVRVNAAAFAHHPEQGTMTADELAQRMAEPWFDPEGLLLAFEGDRLLGFHWTKVHRTGEGEVYVLGLAPEAQGRGLGRILTLAGLHHLASRGVPSVHLYTESDNAAAINIYEGLGFVHEETHVQYRRR